MKAKPTPADMVTFAKAHGLKRLKVGSLEIEFSDYELASDYANKAGLTLPAITPTNNVTQTPPPPAEATDSPLLTEDLDDELLFASTI